MQPAVALQRDSSQLEALIAKLKEAGESELLIEHLQTAAAYLQGAMPEECAHNLEMARRAAAASPNKPVEDEVQRIAEELLRQMHPPLRAHWRHHAKLEPFAPLSTADGLEEFFHGAGLSLGMFYPKKHAVAVFPSFHDAQSAHDALWAAGFRGWEAIAAPGYEVDEFLGRIRRRQSLWARFMTQVSRVLDTEAGLVDRYTRWARHGAGFVIAYSPTEEQAEGIRDLLQPLHPLDLHWFMPSYIRDLL